jgi:hypothetical protein
MKAADAPTLTSYFLYFLLLQPLMAQYFRDLGCGPEHWDISSSRPKIPPIADGLEAELAGRHKIARLPTCQPVKTRQRAAETWEKPQIDLGAWQEW